MWCFLLTSCEYLTLIISTFAFVYYNAQLVYYDGKYIGIPGMPILLICLWLVCLGLLISKLYWYQKLIEQSPSEEKKKRILGEKFNNQLQGYIEDLERENAEQEVVIFQLRQQIPNEIVLPYHETSHFRPSAPIEQRESETFELKVLTTL